MTGQSSETCRNNARSRVARVIGAACAAMAASISFAVAGKDAPPAGACDTLANGSTAWTKCVGASARLSDEESFYAGYWMAQVGRYADAIRYLKQVRSPDARTLTYLGFATRKAGDVDNALGYYRQALILAPDFVVARAYMGEAFLTKGDLTAARAELGEIARRCGTTCAAYDDLARHVAKAETARG